LIIHNRIRILAVDIDINIEIHKMRMPKLRHTKALVALLLLVGVPILAVPLSMQTAHAAAKCAILYGGPVDCRDLGKTGECYLADPASPSAGKNGFVKISCTDKRFVESYKSKGVECRDKNNKVIPCDAALKCTTNCDLVGKYATPLINVLAALVGVAATASIIMGGIQYAASADDPQKVNAAKRRIMNSLFALLAFLFFYAFLQWLVPGGVLYK